MRRRLAPLAVTIVAGLSLATLSASAQSRFRRTTTTRATTTSSTTAATTTRATTTSTTTAATTTAATSTTRATTSSTTTAATTTAATTSAPTTTQPVTGSGGSSVGGCAMLPPDNAWNRDISTLPVRSESATWVTSVGAVNLHADFGSNPSYGIPFVVVPATQPPLPITFTAYGDESDPGPYPVPLTAPVEAGSDAHVLAVQQGTCQLYEMFGAAPNGTGWNAASGAVFNLASNALRPKYWTSADAAGLPILPGLARYDEIKSGRISHALRFTVPRSQRAFIAPATHYAGTVNASLSPMGARFRLKASFDLAPYTGDALVILTALKQYGMIVADNGTGWYISGATDARWNDTDLNQLKKVPGSMFEVVDTGPLQT